MEQFHVNLKKTVDDSYDIVIGSGLLHVLQEDLIAQSCGMKRNVAIITDSNVYAYYGAQFERTVKNALPDVQVNTVVFRQEKKAKRGRQKPISKIS